MRHRLAIIVGTLLRLLAAWAVILSVSACADDVIPEPAGACDPVRMRFTVVTSRPAEAARQTRAADISGDLTGSASENYLNIAGHDIRFLLFDGDRKLLRDFTPYAGINLASGDGGNYVTYSVDASIVEPYFANAAVGDIDFYIMVLANGRTHHMMALGLAPGETTIADVSGQLVTFVHQPNIIVDPETYQRGAWQPSPPGVADGDYILMSGLQHFTLKKGAFDGKGPEDFVELSQNINMLRSLAKIEVIDRIGISGNTADAPERISKVEIFGRCATGTVLPSYGQWNRNGVLETQQVDAPTMASPMQYFPPTTDGGYIRDDGYNINWNSQAEFYEDKAAQAIREDGCPVFSAYLAEYSLDALNGLTPPCIRVEIGSSKGGDDDKKDEAGGQYYFQLARFQGGKEYELLPALLRNHIYRYEIVSVNTRSSRTWSVSVSSEVGNDL